VISGGPLLIRAWMQQVLELRIKFGIETIWVTSGAIASARDRTGFNKKKRTLPEKQALSAIGQPLIMDTYNLALQSVGKLGAQVLITREDLLNRTRKINFINTIETLLKWKVLPILNENDAISTEEIQFGDNDSLSAQVAIALNADRLILLTDVDGLFDKDPRKFSNARKIIELPRITTSLLKSLNSTSGSSRGTGGMFSKALAAKKATAHQIPTWLAKGDQSQVLIEIARNKTTGTRIGSKIK
jgi:glutamate 5-kinase